MARLRGARGVWGRALESAGAPPYWPWRQILRAIGDFVDLRAIADDHRLTVDLAQLAPDVLGGSERAGDNIGSIEDRFRQFDALGRLLRQVTLQGPLVIVFDDAHWADESSLVLLQHLSRTLRDESLLMLVNYRDTERSYAALFAELLREPVTRQIHLGGLEPPAVGRQLALVAGREVSEAEVQQVHALTAGNPFFIAEIGRVLGDSHTGGSRSVVTANVREAIGARLGRLSRPSVQLLQTASVVGREFSVGLLAAMLNKPVMSSLSLLDEAVRAGLVERTPAPGEHRFVHALVRDAIEAGLGTPERVRLHRMAAEVVEHFYGGRLDQHLFDLARHWAVAAVEGDRARALHWIERAAEEAMRRQAYEEGVRLFRLALDVGAGELDELRKYRLLLALGSALHLSADIQGRLDACLQAAALARAIERPELMAEAALILEPVGLYEFDLHTRRLCDEAMSALDSADTELRVRLMARFAEACDYLRDEVAALAASEQALTLAEQCGERAAMVTALRARRLVCAGPDGLEERSLIADRMLALGRESGNPNTQLWAHQSQIDAFFELGDLARVVRELEPLAWCVHEVRGPFARWELLRYRAMLAQAQARFDDARRLVHQAFATVAPTGHIVGFYSRAGLLQVAGHHIGQDNESLAASGLSTAKAITEGDFPSAPMQALAMAHLLTEVGRISEARAIYRSLGPVADWRLTPHSVLFGYAFGNEIAIALDASDDVITLRSLLAPYRGHHVVSGAGAIAYYGPVELCLGKAAAHLDLMDDAVEDLEQAVKACAVSAVPGFHAEAQYELTAALARRDRPGDMVRAGSLIAAVAKQAAELGMVPIASKARELEERLDGAESSLPLTRREVEVAQLVAQGLTNRQIAARLYLSERTAQNHVQHILTKLDLSNRSQIAVWATSQK